MPHLFRVDRVRGCLLGLAVGDALGCAAGGVKPAADQDALRSRHELRGRRVGMEAEATSMADARVVYG